MHLRSAISFLLVVWIFSPLMAARFTIEGSVMTDPDGREFIPIGTNVVGWNYYDWANKTVSYADVIEKAWKFNIVRANITLEPMTWDGNQFGAYWKENESACQDSLDAIVGTYTSRKIVVMLEIHDWTGSYPMGDDLALLSDFYRWAAVRYKENPYVWFNIINEPQWSTTQINADPYWTTMHRQIIALIRDTVGADNVIICDGVHVGNECYTWDNNPVPAEQSAVLSFGAQVKQFNNKTYPNIGFSLHTYSQWGFESQLFDTKLIDYIDRVHALGHFILIGEVGARGWDDTHNAQNTGTVYRVCIPRKVGFLQWHFESQDGFSLLSNYGPGSGIDSWTAPTNLSDWCGVYFWQAVHEHGWGLNNDQVGARIAPASENALHLAGPLPAGNRRLIALPSQGAMERHSGSFYRRCNLVTPQGRSVRGKMGAAGAYLSGN